MGVSVMGTFSNLIGDISIIVMALNYTFSKILLRSRLIIIIFTYKLLLFQILTISKMPFHSLLSNSKVFNLPLIYTTH